MSEDNGYEIVARPPKGRRPLLEALAATAKTGQAVRIPLDGASEQNLRGQIYSGAKTRGLRAHTMKDGSHLIVWAEKP